ETKPGPQTTEFWVTIFSNALGLLQMIAGPVNVSDNKVATLLAVVNAAYAASRGLAKQGVKPDPTPLLIPADEGDAGVPDVPPPVAAQPPSTVPPPPAQ